MLCSDFRHFSWVINHSWDNPMLSIDFRHIPRLPMVCSDFRYFSGLTPCFQVISDNFGTNHMVSSDFGPFYALTIGLLTILEIFSG